MHILPIALDSSPCVFLGCCAHSLVLPPCVQREAVFSWYDTMQTLRDILGLYFPPNPAREYVLAYCSTVCVTFYLYATRRWHAETRPMLEWNFFGAPCILAVYFATLKVSYIKFILDFLSPACWGNWRDCWNRTVMQSMAMFWACLHWQVYV